MSVHWDKNFFNPALTKFFTALVTKWIIFRKIKTGHSRGKPAKNSKFSPETY